MIEPIYRLYSMEGHVAGYYQGHLQPGSIVYVEDLWLPDGSHPKPDGPIPRGIILSSDYVQRIEPDEAPDFVKAEMRKWSVEVSPEAKLQSKRELVWSGVSRAVTMRSLIERGPGLYVVDDGSFTWTLHIENESEDATTWRKPNYARKSEFAAFYDAAKSEISVYEVDQRGVPTGRARDVGKIYRLTE